MQNAELAATRSTCSRARVGVVIAKSGRVISTGYNGTPAGMDHCIHLCNCFTTKGGHTSECASVAPCLEAVHAEANAIAWAARCGVALEGAELFTTFSPCRPCGQLIINAGIIRVVYLRAYRDQSIIETLRNGKIQVDFFEELDV